MSSPTPLWRALHALAARLRRASVLAIGSDFDGTLAEIVEHPDLAAISPRARAILQRLAEQRGVHVGVFSGRRVSDLVQRVGVEPVWYSGVCGLEVRDTSRVRHDPPIESGGVPASLLDSLRAWCDTHPGTWVQDKGRAIAVHYRQLPMRLQAAFSAGVRRRLRPHRNQVQAEPGKKVFEIMPAVALDKGWALEHWLAGLPASPVVVYMGDDINDERAYPFVRARGGIAITVARRSSTAEFSVPSPTDVLWWLEWLSQEWAAIRIERGTEGHD